MTKKEAAKMIDISAVRTPHTYEDIVRIVKLAEKYGFINVHVLPNWVPVLAGMLSTADGVYVGAPVGFPAGANGTLTKIVEAQQLIKDGVEEMDIVMNIGRFRNKEYDYVLQELKAVIALAHACGRPVMTKVIIEINALTDEEMLKACDLVMESGADFIKTGTGWIPGDANLDRIRRIKEYCGSRIKIKAAGGIRTRKEFDELVNMGVERMGINERSAMEIVDTFEEQEKG